MVGYSVLARRVGRRDCVAVGARSGIVSACPVAAVALAFGGYQDFGRPAAGGGAGTAVIGGPACGECDARNGIVIFRSVRRF